MQNSAEPKVVVVIVNFNGFQDTIVCLEQLSKINYQNFNVVIVDNASNDQSVDYLRDWLSNRQSFFSGTFLDFDSKSRMFTGKMKTSQESANRVVVIASDFNGGFAFGNNVAIDYIENNLDFQYVWLLNNDTVPHVDSLHHLVRKAQINPSLGLIGSKLVYYHSPGKLQGYGGRFNKWFCTGSHLGEGKDLHEYQNENLQIDYPIGASMLVSKLFIEKVGKMAEEYFLYFEELDWVLRGKKFNLTTSWCTESIVLHKEGASIGLNKNVNIKSELADIYSISNRLLFARKFYPWHIPFVLAGIIGSLLIRVRRKQFSRISKIATRLIKVTLVPYRKLYTK